MFQFNVIKYVTMVLKKIYLTSTKKFEYQEIITGPVRSHPRKTTKKHNSMKLNYYWSCLFLTMYKFLDISMKVNLARLKNRGFGI